MKNNNAYQRYFALFLPWALAMLFKSDPVISYAIAWLGSFLIFYLTMSGWVRAIPDDRTVAEQLMRPLFIVQIIFAGYMCCTSIFYFFNVLNIGDAQKLSTVSLIDVSRLELTAQCQRYYCLAHASFVSGILVCMNYPGKKKYQTDSKKLANFLLMFALISFPLTFLFNYLDGLYQFAYQFSALSFISGTLALAFAIPLRKLGNTLVCIFLYLFNFYNALLSGYKEPIIISVMVLGIFLYPNYKKIVTIVFGPVMILLFLLLPTYVTTFRESAWSDASSTDDASEKALDATLNTTKDDKDETNNTFLVYRFSEIDMFTKFVQSTPSQIDYYGTTILVQSMYAIIPRYFWPGKPSTEEMVMERVYDAGVVHRGSVVSAKPAFVVDAYLSYGGLGVFFFLFLYGAAAQLIALRAEYLFGGYILGTALIFSGLFQIMWRGLSFEFLVNTVFWSFVSMLLIQKVLLYIGLIKET